MKKISIVLIAFVFSSCSKDISTIARESERASFIIYTYDEYGTPSGSGSGFFINEDGTAITNYHVLDGAVKAIIVTGDSSKYEVDKVIASDAKKDLLVFKIKKTEQDQFEALSFANSTPDKGERIYCISNPLGLENSLSEGIVSGIRRDKDHGKTIQFSAPISPGSSGGAIVNKDGNVVAIASFMRRGGQNLNFGIPVTDEIIKSLTQNDFKKYNPKFFKSDQFVVFNLSSDNSPSELLNAIEFSDNVTTAYFTSTRFLISESSGWGKWLEIGRKDEGSYIKDLLSNDIIYITSSTIGNDREHMTMIPLATSLRYKIYYPRLKTPTSKFEVSQCSDSRCSRWSNINITDFKNLNKFNLDNFRIVRAISTLKEGNLLEAQSLFLEITDYDRENVEAFIALGVISYASDNKKDALSYFSKAIEINPSFDETYVNRQFVYKSQGNFAQAIEDISKAIGINSDQPDYYIFRESLYLITGDREKARDDYFKWRAIYEKDLKFKKNESVESLTEEQKIGFYDWLRKTR